MNSNPSIEILKRAEQQEQDALSQLLDSVNQKQAVIENIRASIKLIENSLLSSAPIIFKSKMFAEPINGNIKSARRRDTLDTIAETLRAEGRFLHKRQIEKITGLVNISAVLSTASAQGRKDITNFVPGKTKNQTVYGFKGWKDENGKPQADFMYDEEYVLAIK